MKTIHSSIQRWYVLAAVSLTSFLAAVMGTSVNVAMPSLVEVLNTPFAIVQWVALGFLLISSVLLPSIGRLADMFGKKPLYLTGILIFMLGSALCAMAPGISWLIAFRIVQGIGAAFLMALGLAIVTEVFPQTERGRAIGINGAVLSSGIVVGPTLGGLLLDLLSWRWIFWINVPLSVIAFLMALLFIPRPTPLGKQRFDFMGAVTLFLSLSAVLLALTIGQQSGFSQPLVQGLFLLSGLLMIAFILLELRLAEPMIDLAIFRSSLFSVSLITGFLVFVSIAGTIFLMPFYLENVLGFKPRNVGLLMSVVPIVLVIMAPIAGALSDRFGTRVVSFAGICSLMIGYSLIRGFSTEVGVAEYLLRFLPIGLGMGTFQTPNNTAIMSAVPKERLGVAGGLLSLTRTIGQTTGISALGAFWAYRVIQLSADSNATSAAPELQVLALQDMIGIIQVMIGIALATSIWGLWRARRKERLQAEGFA